jgi:hypothetical protein
VNEQASGCQFETRESDAPAGHFFSGIHSFEVKVGSRKHATFWRPCAFKIAESLGDVESRFELRGVITHVSVPKQERKKAGLDDGLIKFVSFSSLALTRVAQIVGNNLCLNILC